MEHFTLSVGSNLHLMENDFTYKWKRLFASKRYHKKDGVIKLTPEEQQELIDDASKLHQPTVISAVCEHNFVPSIKEAKVHTCVKCSCQRDD